MDFINGGRDNVVGTATCYVQEGPELKAHDLLILFVLYINVINQSIKTIKGIYLLTYSLSHLLI